MDNFIYNADRMIHLQREHLQRLYQDAGDLIDIIDNSHQQDVHHQVATYCAKSRPLCRGDHWCTRPCVVRDPWDETLLPKLSEAESLDDWLQAHGIHHRHPFYHNFCEEHMGQFELSNEEWVPSKPKLERGVVRHCVHVEQQEGPLYYLYDSSDLEGDDIDVSELVSESS